MHAMAASAEANPFHEESRPVRITQSVLMAQPHIAIAFAATRRSSPRTLLSADGIEKARCVT